MKVQVEGVTANEFGWSNIFHYLWSKDSETWDVRCSDIRLVQPEFNSCCQMVASNGTWLRILGIFYIDTDRTWGVQAMSTCMHQLIIYGAYVQQGWPTGGM